MRLRDSRQLCSGSLFGLYSQCSVASHMTGMAFDKPTFPLWRTTHNSLAARNPDDYAQKENTRRSYVWIVLSEIQYDPALTGVRQRTWRYGKHGEPTASGLIRRHWFERERHHFVVAAVSQHRSENYVVVFSASGRFITVYCPTRCDLPASAYPISLRDGVKLLRLSETVGEYAPRRITTEDIRFGLLGKTPVNQMKAMDRMVGHTLPRGALLGLVVNQEGQYSFACSHEKLKYELLAMNPMIEDEYVSRTMA
jgi:hypothetical protein